MLPMPRFPPQGPLGRLFPCFIGTIKALRLPAVLPLALRFLRLRAPRGHASFAPAAAACRRDGPGVVHPVSPSGKSSVEAAGSPKFLGNPNSRLRMFSDPGRPRYSRPLAERSRGPRYAKHEGAGSVTISEFDSMAFGLAVYASRCRLPFTAQDSLPGAGQALPDGLSTRRVPLKGF